MGEIRWYHKNQYAFEYGQFPRSGRQRLSCGTCHPETPALQVFVEGFWKAVRGLEIGCPKAHAFAWQREHFVRQRNVHLESVASKARWTLDLYMDFDFLLFTWSKLNVKKGWSTRMEISLCSTCSIGKSNFLKASKCTPDSFHLKNIWDWLACWAQCPESCNREFVFRVCKFRIL